MAKTEAFATKLPAGLKKTLDDVCRRFGLKKNFVVEQALREKLEDLMDAWDLDQAIKTTTGYRDWEEVKRDLKRRGRL